MSKFCLKVIAGRQERIEIQNIIPGFKNADVQFFPVSQLDSILTATDPAECLVIWIDGTSKRTLQIYCNNNQRENSPENIILTGREITLNDAVQLGHMGFSRIFQIPGNATQLKSEIITQYEGWKIKQQDSRSRFTDDIELVGSSPPINALRKLVKKVAPRSKLMVLLRGETGTGKGLIAKMLHNFSPRSDQPFVEINCTAIPDGLIESELFGHEKGAFTDAHRSRKGIFELAHGGTLFLDEIGYLRPEIQVKLLKVLEDRRFRRVGGEKDIQVDCRIITGTSVDLEQKVQDNSFRKDLYYRLNVFPIVVPPLRERGQDILRLADHFREFFSAEHGLETEGFDETAIQYLLSDEWSGNVRELKHCIERAVILSENQKITVEALAGTLVFPDEKSEEQSKASVINSMTGQDSGTVLQIMIPKDGKTMDQIQKEVIEGVLQMTSGNRSEAARILDISRSRLLRRIKTDD